MIARAMAMRRLVGWTCTEAATANDELAWGLRANLSITVHFASDATSQVRLRLHGSKLGLKLSRDFQDFGVVQSAIGNRADGVAQRWRTFEQRMQRVAKLMVRKQQRARLGAVSAITAETFGATAHPPTQEMVVWAKRWMKYAIWRGSGLASIELTPHVSGDS